ncbi:uncharacterized protein LOC119517604 [Choloepus didactylus]|uniref:uncharacterized protein LOC119517604 n=1 Tax=Choloepus didactylus TaxID=27675 RepID=UPI0018A0D4AB|nr:uncharacterized protein LOC119517604 [Choloepus didactylus]
MELFQEESERGPHPTRTPTPPPPGTQVASGDRRSGTHFVTPEICWDSVKDRMRECGGSLPAARPRQQDAPGPPFPSHPGPMRPAWGAGGTPGGGRARAAASFSSPGSFLLFHLSREGEGLPGQMGEAGRAGKGCRESLLPSPVASTAGLQAQACPWKSPSRPLSSPWGSWRRGRGLGFSVPSMLPSEGACSLYTECVWQGGPLNQSC